MFWKQRNSRNNVVIIRSNPYSLNLWTYNSPYISVKWAAKIGKKLDFGRRNAGFC